MKYQIHKDNFIPTNKRNPFGIIQTVQTPYPQSQSLANAMSISSRMLQLLPSTDPNHTRILYSLAQVSLVPRANKSKIGPRNQIMMADEPADGGGV
jgi:hypothetical protein